MTVTINGTTGISPVTAAGTSALVDGMTVGRGAGEVATNTAVGVSALQAVTTASNNTAVGYQAGYTNTTGINRTSVGSLAGYSGTAATSTTCIGYYAGYNTTGTDNTLIGTGAGYLITTGAKNTVLGEYSGNQGGLDIRTASNRIVLSDGDGNCALRWDGSQAWSMNSATGNRYVELDFTVNSAYKAAMYWDNTNTNLYVACASGGVYLTNNGTSWTSVSDERLKENLVPIENGLSKVCSLRSVIGNFISDETKKLTPFLIAQDVQTVLPEAVTFSTQKGDETNTEYLGVQYTEVIPLLVAAIKELKAEFDAYKEAHP